MSLRVILDKFFCFYFIYQIVTTVFLESQATFPAKLYPQFLRDTFNSYLESSRDPFMGHPDVFLWCKVICVMEILFIPLFFAGAYAYALGARRCPWIRGPCLVYSVWCITVVPQLIAGFLLEDFTELNIRAPRNYQERLKISAMYSLYFLIALLMLWDTWCGCGYKTKDKPEAKKTD